MIAAILMVTFSVEEANSTEQLQETIKYRSRICIFGGDRCKIIRLR